MKFYISEAEAMASKTCPLTIATIPEGGPYGCIGSACMAWRWVRTHINNPACPEGDLIASGDTHGYCGMAGVPQAFAEEA